MTAKLMLDKKREGRALGSAEIREFIEGFTSGEIPDYQMAAFAMAVCCRGMNERETADLTEAMKNSGRCLEWAGLATADKHSTGGVGDKLSLVVQPLAASCGVSVPSLTGRGLGITGGTADKLETIPGYSCSQTLDRFQEIVRGVGVSMAVQTDEITPADKKLYALRDVTGTVASIPLIVSSILSKKLAEGAGALVFDVKCGRGAFMKTRDEASALAAALVSGAEAAGRKAAALVTRMDEPLGFAVGNVNEVAEALEILKSRPERLADVTGLCVELAAGMVSLARGIPPGEAARLCSENLESGAALDKFEKMVEAHGGDLESFRRFAAGRTFKFRIQAMRSGYVEAIDAEKVAGVALRLGAGREKAGDAIDPLAGVTLAVRRGDRVFAGAPLATLEKSRSPDGLEAAAAELYKAFSFAAAAPEARPLVIERIGQW
ncbi:MAG: thymidine phosphorylase [Kiritimatiellae bacterium]|nr:thymidine phosphorylase [Kiritimatiellia bacterium]